MPTKTGRGRPSKYADHPIVEAFSLYRDGRYYKVVKYTIQGERILNTEEIYEGRKMEAITTYKIAAAKSYMYHRPDTTENK